MSAYSSLKEMYKDTTQIIQGKDTAGKTVYLLKQFCFFAVCLLYLIEKCGFREVILSYVNIEITLPQIICDFLTIYLYKIIYVFLTIFLYLPKCPQSLILSALRAFCFCGKPHISRSIFLYFRYQAWLKSW